MLKISLVIAALLFYLSLYSNSEFSLSLESNSQYYFNDIDQNIRDKQYASNTFIDTYYQYNNLKLGITIETYYPNPLLGFSGDLKQKGLTNYYLNYSLTDFNIRIGNFYEQLGSGLIFRSYRERDLGIDNSILGVNLNYKFSDYFDFKLFGGKQTAYFHTTDSYLYGADFNSQLNLNDLNFQLGFSTLVKQEEYSELNQNENDNTKLYSTRFSFDYSNINLKTEFAYKTPDANFENEYNIQKGRALSISSSYTDRGIGINLNFRAIDNMSILSDRQGDGDGNGLTDNETIAYRLNYIPSIAKIHDYNLYNVYTYQTNPNNEIGFNLNALYKFKKKSFLGGKYGTKLQVNYSSFYNQSKAQKEPEFLSFNDKLYSEINLSIDKKFSKLLKVKFEYNYQEFNQFYIYQTRDKPKGEFLTYSNSLLSDILMRFNRFHALKIELGYLFSENGLSKEIKGEKKYQNKWFSSLVEYLHSSGISIYFADQYNLDAEKEHYLNSGIVYNYSKLRLALSYGKNREGYTCVGGVCKYLPESNAMSLSLSYKF